MTRRHDAPGPDLLHALGQPAGPPHPRRDWRDGPAPGLERLIESIALDAFGEARLATMREHARRGAAWPGQEFALAGSGEFALALAEQLRRRCREIEAAAEGRA